MAALSRDATPQDHELRPEYYMRYTNPPHSDEFIRLFCRVPRSSDVPQELFIPGLCDGASATRGGRVGQVLDTSPAPGRRDGPAR